MDSRVWIGLLVNYTHAYYQGVLHGIRAYADVHPDWHFIPLKEVEGHLKWRGAVRPAGIIASVNTPAIVRALRRWHRPLVSVSSVLPDLPYPRVAADGEQIGRMVAQHLLERGLKHFAFVGHPRHVYSVEREQAFCAALGEAGAECFCFHARPDQPFEEHGHIGYLDRHAETWLVNLPKPVGIMAANDWFGVEVAEVCQLTGMRVPEDVAIVGVANDSLYSGFSRPPLSSVVLPSQQIGYEAAALLDRLIAGERPPPAPLLLAPTHVHQRRSSEVLAIDDAEVIAAVRFIREHAHAPIGVADVLREVPLSRRSLERRVHLHLGLGVAELIRRAHIERCQKLLVETNLSLSVVAQQAGFSGDRHMLTVFRRDVGIAPSDYRVRHQADAARTHH